MTDLLLDTKKEIESLGFNIISYDFNRPWGGFLLIDESQSKEFISKFISNENLKIENKVSPKILIVNPNSRLSWQYHNRRKEIWKVFKNEVGVIKSTDNNETVMKDKEHTMSHNQNTTNKTNKGVNYRKQMKK